jgi:hypothetical protein
MALAVALLVMWIAGTGAAPTFASARVRAPSVCPVKGTTEGPAASTTCYYAPEVYLTPSSGTVAVNQTFTFTLEVWYAEYGCTKDGAWSGTISTDSAGHYGPQSITVGPFASAGTYTYGLSCGGRGGTNPGSTVVTVTPAGGGDPGSGGGPGCTENLTSQIHATFVSMSGVPASITAGGSFTALVTFQNTGACTWTAANGYRLGSQNPENNTTWGTSRAYLGASEAIGPGQSKTFTINAVAPATAGTYGWGWRMVREGINWMGTPTNATFTSISVTGSVPPQPSPPTISSFTASPKGVFTGGTTTLSWSSNATSCQITSSPSGGSWTNLPASGSVTSPALAQGNYSYTLICSNNGGQSSAVTYVQALNDTEQGTLSSGHASADLGFDTVMKCRWKQETNWTNFSTALGIRWQYNTQIRWCVSNGYIRRVTRQTWVSNMHSWNFVGTVSNGPCNENCDNYVTLYGRTQTSINIWTQGHFQWCLTFPLVGAVYCKDLYPRVGVLIRGDGTRDDTY